MRKYILSSLFLLSSATLFSMDAEESIYIFSQENNEAEPGHHYKVVTKSSGVSWNEARKIARNLGGYLASIDSEEENDFIYSHINKRKFWKRTRKNGSIGPWIGGLINLESESTDPQWKWDSGKNLDFSAWHPGQPNNHLNSGQNRIHYFSKSSCRSSKNWNDLQEDNSHLNPVAFVVEIDPSRIQWPVNDGGNNHFYQAVATEEPLSWKEASARAQEMGGHLATITSAEENDFVFSISNQKEFWRTANKNYGPWLGALKVEGKWTWITGEDFSFDNWERNEPNNTRGNEDYIHFFNLDKINKTWNDTPNFNTRISPSSFIVEYK